MKEIVEYNSNEFTSKVTSSVLVTSAKSLLQSLLKSLLNSEPDSLPVTSKLLLVKSLKLLIVASGYKRFSTIAANNTVPISDCELPHQSKHQSQY